MPDVGEPGEIEGGGPTSSAFFIDAPDHAKRSARICARRSVVELRSSVACGKAFAGRAEVRPSMRYMCLIYNPADEAATAPEALAAALPAYHAFTEEARARKAYVDAAALANPTSATTVHALPGKHSITDGPFVESKEWLGGYFVLECATLDDAIDLVQRIPVAPGGAVEIRPIRDT